MFWCPPASKRKLVGTGKTNRKSYPKLFPLGSGGRANSWAPGWKRMGAQVSGHRHGGTWGAQIGRHRPNPPRYPPNIFPCSPISVPSRFVHPAPPPPFGPWRPSPPALSAPLVLTVPYRDRCHYYRNSCDDMLARKKENLPQNTN